MFGLVLLRGGARPVLSVFRGRVRHNLDMGGRSTLIDPMAQTTQSRRVVTFTG